MDWSLCVACNLPVLKYDVFFYNYTSSFMSLQTFFVTGEIDKITNFEVINPHVGIRRSDEIEVCGHITIINIYSVNLYYLSFISVEINFYWNIHRMRVVMITVTAPAVDGGLS